MNYARWETIENMVKLGKIKGISVNDKVETSGLPMAYDDENLYIDQKSSHSLIIGSTGSGKTQTITLPMLKLACLASESVIVNDSNDEIYQKTKEDFKNSGYTVIKLDFDERNECNYWNPFELAKKFFKENADEAEEIIEDIGYYLLIDPNEKEVDPFWSNSAISYFTGLCLYLLENGEEINFQKVYELDCTIREDVEKFRNSLDKNSSAYINLSGILFAPVETRGSIFSVFTQKFKKYISKQNLKEILSKSDFNLEKINTDKMIIYVNSGKTSLSNSLLPLFISQIYNIKTEDNKLNIIIDDFFGLYPIKDFEKMLTYSRSVYTTFTIMVRGLNDLKNTYGFEKAETLKLCFSNIVYLLSQDIGTLEEISKLCGTSSIINGQALPLISVEELKTLKTFEAIIITTRIMPFKTKLLPYYELVKSLK